jgi:hypothetical protein
LDIGQVASSTALNIFLFQLLVFKSVTVGISVYHLDPGVPVYIEIANTHNDALREALGVPMAFSLQPMTWDMNRFMFSQDISSAGQIVCNYLARLDSGDLDKEDLVFNQAQQHAPVNVECLDQATCRKLIRSHFEPAAESECSFASVHVFMKVLAGQLRRFTLSVQFSTLQVTDMLGKKGERSDVRSQIIKALVRVAQSFAVRSVRRAKDNQRAGRQQLATSSTAVDVEQIADALVDRAAFDESQTWEGGNHVLVIFQRQNENCISALYRDKSKLEPSLVFLLESQRI